MVEVIFWFALLIIIYVYLGYPALLVLLRPFFHKPLKADLDHTPAVSFVIAAFNEEAEIEAKLANCLAFNYPEQNIEIIVVSDGSEDRTAERVRHFIECHKDANVQLVELPRSGKMKALNQGVEIATGEILLLTDANAFAPQNSLRELISLFNDPSVGAATAIKYALKPGQQMVVQGEMSYWKYESRLKQMESDLGSCTGAEGAFYAIRRSLFPYLDEPAQADDLAISLRVICAGFRLVQCPRSIVFESIAEHADTEFQRKTRITNHSLRALFHLPRKLWYQGWFSLALISHKLLRYFLPPLFIVVLISNVLLVQQNLFYVITLTLQIAIYLLAGIGYLRLGKRLQAILPAWGAYYFVRSNIAIFYGLCSMLRGERCVAWRPRHGLSKD